VSVPARPIRWERVGVFQPTPRFIGRPGGGGGGMFEARSPARRLPEDGGGGYGIGCMVMLSGQRQRNPHRQ